MKVLILTASIGGGHHSVKNAISHLLDKNGIENEDFDIIFGDDDNDKEDIIKATKQNTKSWYIKLLKNAPSIWRLFYKMTDNFLVRLIYATHISKILRLRKKIKEYKPNLIFSVSPLSVSLLKVYFISNEHIPFIQVFTDFPPHYEYVDKNVDAYIVGTEYTANQLIKRKSVNKDKIYIYGIPVDDKYILNENEKPLTLSNEILIMLGSLGYDKDINKIYNFLNKTDKKVHFITGSNKELKETLEHKYKDKIKEKKLLVYGYINDVDKIIRKCDLVITKPGGLSITECINLKKPMILVNPIPGHEEENLKIIEKYGICRNGVNEDINKLVTDLYNNPKQLDIMVNNIDKIKKTYSKNKIVDLIKKLVQDDSISN